ncbi:hypothetical protein V8E51_000127 [Hyaloscypha variabilis]
MAEVVGIVGSALGIVGFAGQLLQGCQNIRTFLDSVDWSGEAEQWDMARLALDYSDEAVTGLQSLVNEYDSRKSGIWSDVRMVMRKGKFDRHLVRIEKAKGYILASRTNLSFILELKKSGLHQDTEETLRAISTLNAKVNATVDIVSNVPNQLQEVNNTTVETRGAIENLTRSIALEFAHIPTGVGKMLEGTLRRVMQDFHDRVLIHTDGASLWEPPPAYTNIHDSKRSQELLSGCKASERRVLKKKQKQGRIVIQTWFGIVFIHSTLVKAQDTVNQHGLKIRLGTAKTVRVHVEVAITPCLLRLGLFCSIIWNKMPENRSGFDVKLRVYNTVDESSAIIQACREANLEEVQKLFATAKASPFDRLQGKQSLLDIILEEMVLVPMRRNPEFAWRKLENLYLIFRSIICHGLDPGQLGNYQSSKFCGSPLPFLTQFYLYAPPKFLPVLLNITRTIIEHSIQDPFATADFTEQLRFLQWAKTRTPRPVFQFLVNQEHWQPEWEIKEKLTPFLQGQKPEDLRPYDVGCFRTWLRVGADRREVLMAVCESSKVLSDAVLLDGLPDEVADQLRYQHLVACLDYGLDFQDDHDGPSLLTIFREAGKLYQIRAALWYFHWNNDDIDELFEADLLTSLTFQLAHLERRDLNGRKLPVELQFKSVLLSDWNSYLESGSSWGTDQKFLHSLTNSQSDRLKTDESDPTSKILSLESRSMGTRIEILKVLNNFPFVIIIVVIISCVTMVNVWNMTIS